MAIYLKKFETQSAYEAAQSGLILPNVSLTVDNNTVHYNPYIPPYTGFCKLTLNNGSTVELEGSGELTSAMTNDYKSTLSSAEIGTQCTSIGSSAFQGCTGLTSVTIGNSVTTIGDGAFDGCSGLTSVAIGNGVTSIGTAAFEDCSGLTNVTIPNSVTSIGHGTFNLCTSLSSVTIGSGVTSIGNGAFSNCRSLTSIDIPNSVTSIGGRAFDGCTSLSTIRSYIMNAPSVYPGTFANVSNGGTLYVPKGSSGYETWMNNQGNLGLYNWIKVEQ